MDQAITIIKNQYKDFGPSLAHEKLIENHGFQISITTLRTAMIVTKLWKPKQRKKAKIYQLRERRACFGELIQLDGSPHDWFEGRGPRCNLNVIIDDATNICSAKFSKSETTHDYFDLLEEYIKQYGIPMAIYVDKHSVFRVNTPSTFKKPNKYDQYEGLTQFGRACRELDIELIFANGLSRPYFFRQNLRLNKI